MTDILSAALEQWKLVKSDVPPSEDTVLFQDESAVLYVDAKYGPAIPYFGFDHGDGQVNHGYMSTKGNPEGILSIPEVQGFDNFAKFILKLNSIESPVESLGCEKLEREVDLDHPIIRRFIGTYTDIAFTDVAKSEIPEANIELAVHLVRACSGCAEWWSRVEIALQRLKHFHGAQNPWGIMVRITGYGGDIDQARKMWGVTADRLGNACASFEASGIERIL